MANLGRSLARIRYYLVNILRDTVPQSWFRAQLRGLLEAVPEEERAGILQRVAYYNRLEQPFRVSPAASPVARIPMGSSMYYYDVKQYARYFPRDWRLDHVFGDVIHVPDSPSIVKSRPVGGDNVHSVLLNLDKLRHFRRVEDPWRFSEKIGAAVWRGAPSNPMRARLVERFHDHDRFDIGMAGAGAPEKWRKRPLSIPEQLRYRYVISIEGYDVATNLKWILASRSLCLMPASRYETWFMEGRLLPGVHYVELAEDFSDLEEKIDHYESHPDEAEAIIAAAYDFHAQFSVQWREDIIALLVLARYFRLSGKDITELPAWAC